MRTNLIIVEGLAGSGKSTTAGRIAGELSEQQIENGQTKEARTVLAGMRERDK